jgi:acetyl-CoA carboxylase biotin carboxyl carrier protein
MEARTEKDLSICLLEAMKLRTAMQADVSGVIREIPVQNGQPLEFSQPLFES